MAFSSCDLPQYSELPHVLHRFGNRRGRDANLLRRPGDRNNRASLQVLAASELARLLFAAATIHQKNFVNFTQEPKR